LEEWSIINKLQRMILKAKAHQAMKAQIQTQHPQDCWFSTVIGQSNSTSGKRLGRNRLMLVCLVGLAVLLWPGATAGAATINLIASDPYNGSDSFYDGPTFNWSGGLAPVQRTTMLLLAPITS